MISLILILLTCCLNENEAHPNKSELTLDVMEGDPCALNDPKWYPSIEPYDFLYCHPKTHVYTRQRCSASFNGQQKIFNSAIQQCLLPLANDDPIAISNTTDQTGEDTISESGPKTADPCQIDSDCPQNAYCASNHTCQCPDNFIHAQKLCWKPYPPGEGPCVINEQCSAAWPGAECYQASCSCPTGTVPISTSAGILCSAADHCPLGGPFAMVSDPVDGADPCQSCNEANLVTSPMANLYECIRAPAFSRPLCCPSKAMTCMQPQLSGNGQLNVTRYSYNSITDQCQSFEFYGGTMVNSNVFHTKSHCEQYCRKGCLRGNPEMRNGQSIACILDGECGADYRCYKRDNTQSGLCCPSAESICNPFSGVEALADANWNENDTWTKKEYDVGEEPEKSIAIFFPAVRYFYSPSEKKCKTFLYRGVGGNFNNFLTSEQCMNFCAPTVCHFGGRPAIDTITKKWIRCRLDDHCPSNYTCQNGTCCTGRKMKKESSADYVEQLCPRGAHPMKRENGGLTFCDFQNACPHGGYCRMSTSSTNGEGVCCIGRNVQFRLPRCPGNGNSSVSSDIYHPSTCHLGQEKPCPSPYTCAFTSINSTEGLCCTVPSDSIVCPADMDKVMMEDGKGHRQCSPLHLSSCPDGGVCVFNELYGIYYCCSAHHKLANRCPQGRAAYVDTNSNNPLNCTGMCPAGFECLNSEGSQESKLCCKQHQLAGQCLMGKALVNHNGVPYSCNIDSPCAPGYYCVTATEGRICCPKSDHVCSMTVDFGSSCVSGLEIVSYYFDTTQRICKPFLYRGCGGNDNRFSDADQCNAFCYLSSVCPHGQPFITDTAVLQQQRSDGTIACSEFGGCPAGYICMATAYNRSYCCPAPESVCQEPKSSGIPCDDIMRDVADHERVWYFDYQLKRCQPMTYHGCSGNNNRFLTLDACEQFCHATVCPNGARPLISDRIDVQQCTENGDCKTGYECVSSKVSLQLEPSVCCPKAETVCLSPIEKGESCGVAQRRYSYNRTTGRCESFTYLGCKGNDNNFLQMEVCIKLCSNITTDARMMRSVCGDQSPSPQMIKQCRNSNECPAFHRCSFSNQSGSEMGFCCPTPAKKCLRRSPNALNRTWKFATNLNADECSLNNDRECPANYSCQLTEDGSKQCCQLPDMSEVCPALASGSPTDQQLAIRCEENDNQCPSGFTCIHNRQFGQFFCCSDMEHKPRSLDATARLSSDVMACQDDHAPYVDPYTHTIRVCNPYLLFSCPITHECIYNSYSAQYQCCPLKEPAMWTGEGSSRSACPIGHHPHFQSDHRPIVCQPSTTSVCPPPSICHYSPLYWQFICCLIDGEHSSTKAPGTNHHQSSHCPPNHTRTQDGRCQPNVVQWQYHRRMMVLHQHHNWRLH